MEALVQRLIRVQDIFSELGYEPIELPKIVVVGTQSSGKSSVLESMIAGSFLPRGAGLVTRCPIVLQLIHCPAGHKKRMRFKGTANENLAMLGEFLHQQGEVYTLDKLGLEIEKQTDRLAGTNKGIVATPITLKIYSPSALNLTLVDMPGITKVPVGDQPKDIEKQINSLIRKYISNPMSVILAVVTANTDMATNDSLKLAREVDPEGVRTLAVVTKLDLMDKDVNAYDILTGKVIPVKLGIIGVVNRSQQDLNNKKTLEDSVKDEAQFFKENYPELAAECGSVYLAKKLYMILIQQIIQHLPTVQEKVNEGIQECESHLSKCGKKVEDHKKFLGSAIPKFAAAFRSLIVGGLFSKTLNSAGKIAQILDVTLKRGLMKIDPLQAYTWDEVLMGIRSSEGLNPSFFASEATFRSLVTPQIKRLENPSQRALRLVEEELMRAYEDVLPDEVLRFPLMITKIQSVVKHTVDENLPKTREMISDLIKIHSEHITHNRLDFLKESTIKRIISLEPHEVAKEKLNFKMNATKQKRVIVHQDIESYKTAVLDGAGRNEEIVMSLREQKHILILDRMLVHYFNLVREEVHDSVCKCIVSFLIKHVEAQIEINLITEFYDKETNLTHIFTEKESVEKVRRTYGTRLQALTEASEILDTMEEVITN